MTVRVDGFIMWNLTTTTGLYFERKKGISVLVVYIWRFFVVSSQRFEILSHFEASSKNFSKFLFGNTLF